MSIFWMRRGRCESGAAHGERGRFDGERDIGNDGPLSLSVRMGDASFGGCPFGFAAMNARR